MAALTGTWMASSNLWCTMSQRYGQVDHIALSGEAYCSSHSSTVYVAFVQVKSHECRRQVARSSDRYKRKFQAIAFDDSLTLRRSVAAVTNPFATDSETSIF